MKIHWPAKISNLKIAKADLKATYQNHNRGAFCTNDDEGLNFGLLTQRLAEHTGILVPAQMRKWQYI